MVVVLNEHSGFGSTNAAPTVSAMVKYWLELKQQDAMERAGVPPRSPADEAAPESAPPPVRKVPPPPAVPGEKEKPALGQTGALRVEGSDAGA